MAKYPPNRKFQNSVKSFTIKCLFTLAKYIKEDFEKVISPFDEGFNSILVFEAFPFSKSQRVLGTVYERQNLKKYFIHRYKAKTRLKLAT